jgi:membrane-associated PAP2 superfamily phosphatase
VPGGPDWPLGDRQPWRSLYLYGTLPGLLAALAAAAALGASWAWEKARPWRWPALYLTLALALGPGLLVNVFGKALAGRPRPEDVTAFGGAWQYLEPFRLGIPGRGRSFLCGHCSMGFYFMAFWFVATGWRRWLGLGLGLALGLGLGAARVMQGGHFTSDVLLCGSLLWTLYSLLAPLARRSSPQAPTALEPGNQGRLLLASLPALLLLFGFLFSTPVYEEQRWIWTDPAGLRPKHGPTQRLLPRPAAPVFALRLAKGDVDLSFNSPTGDQVTVLGRGFGFPNAKLRLNPLEEREPGSYGLGLSLSGWFAESKVEAHASLEPRPSLQSAQISTSDGKLTLHTQGLRRPLLLLAPGLQNTPAGFIRLDTGRYQRPGLGPLLSLDLKAPRVEVDDGPNARLAQP